MNLGELAQMIRAEHNLCNLVTETACREFGSSWLRVEDAIVLLGRKRLHTLLSAPIRRSHSDLRLRLPKKQHRSIGESLPVVDAPRGIQMSQIRALIVDDSSVMRKIVERSLRQAGLDLLSVHEAGNGADALRLLDENPVDLILSDINMPVMDGLEFVRHLQTVEKLRGIPVVMITTEGSESNVVQALSFGARGYIRKPFTPDQVKERILPVLGLSQ